MTEWAKEIFEKHQVRKSSKQKAAFIEYATKKAAELGYEVKVEKSYLGAKNIVVGDVDSAKVVYTAHYDTCAVLPFPNLITPTNFGIYLLYNLLVMLGFCVIATALGFGLGYLGSYAGFESRTMVRINAILIFLLFSLMYAGPANRHTANDNTSGVITLFSIMERLPEDQRKNVSFVFFDLEEAGLIGSMGFAKKHKRSTSKKPVINFDCVSDGSNIFFATKNKAASLAEKLTEAFPEKENFKVHVCTKGVFYPSDQAHFPYGVGVAALNRSRRGILYMDKIHTPRDTVFCEENIEFLTDGALRLTQII